MIHPIYAPLKYCNLRYSMRCIFKLIFFCSSSKTKISSRGISKGGFRYVFPLEIIFIFITQKGCSRTPGTLPWLHPCLGTELSFLRQISKFLTNFPHISERTPWCMWNTCTPISFFPVQNILKAQTNSDTICYILQPLYDTRYDASVRTQFQSLLLELKKHENL